MNKKEIVKQNLINKYEAQGLDRKEATKKAGQILKSNKKPCIIK